MLYFSTDMCRINIIRIPGLVKGSLCARGVEFYKNIPTMYLSFNGMEYFQRLGLVSYYIYVDRLSSEVLVSPPNP